MVLALTPTRTTLWDQIRFAGDPRQFLWILPVSDARSVEVAVGSNAFVDGLDQATAPTIVAPSRNCGNDGGLSVNNLFVDVPSASGLSRETSENAVLDSTGRASVGPYAAELVRSSEGSLTSWLRTRNFTVNAENAPVIEHYESMRFDFLVVQFRPGVSVQQMQPIRVTTQGYNPILPLRFAAIGAGENVGLTLMVIAPTQMIPEGWEVSRIEDQQLYWDFARGSSNYLSELSQTFARSPRPWVVESALETSHRELVVHFDAPAMRAFALPTLGVIPADCRFPDEVVDPIRGPDVDGGLAEDGSSEADASSPYAPPPPEAGVDAGDPRCAPVLSTLPAPAAPPASDTSLLASVMTQTSVVTRLHIRLGTDGFSRDLRLSPPTEPMAVPVVRRLTRGVGGACPPTFLERERGCRCTAPGGAGGRGTTGAMALSSLAALTALALVRRRR